MKLNHNPIEFLQTLSESPHFGFRLTKDSRLATFSLFGSKSAKQDFHNQRMKRKNNRSNKTSKKTKNEVSQAVDDCSIDLIGVAIGGDHSGWNILIGKLDFRSQFKISQQNKRLAEMVKLNADYQLRVFQRQIRDNRYM